MKRTPRPALTIFLLLSLVLGASSCRSFRRKFENQQRADLSSFRQQTVALLADHEAPLSTFDLIRLRDYLDASSEEERCLGELAQELRDARLFVIDFSIRLSRLPVNADDHVQVGYLSNLMEELVGRMEVDETTQEMVDNVLVQMRAQGELQQAASESIPLIHAFMDQAMVKVDAVEDAVVAVIRSVEQRIDQRHGKALQRAERLDHHREDLLMAMEAVWRARGGSEEARAFLEQDAAVALVGGLKADDEGLEHLMEQLNARLDWITRVDEALRPDIAEYREDHGELDRVHLEMQRRVNVARLQLILWTMGYVRLASGITEPAEWFDVKSSSTMLLTAGTVVL